VLLLGDLTSFGKREAAEKVISVIDRHNIQIFGVQGNCDYEGVLEYMRERTMSLHGRCILWNGIAFLGVGYSLPCPGRTPGEISDDRIAKFLASAAAGLPAGFPSILVTHEPPFDTGDDLAYTEEHVGSRAIRSFIELHQPLACFCGHIHEGAGIDRIGNTLILNPGPLRRGGYGWACIEGGSIEADIRSL
jgi:Icc-related predicted phosphoesterase